MIPEFDRFEQLDELTGQIASDRLQLGELLAAEREQRIRAYEDYTGSTVSGAGQYADAVTLDLSLDIIKLKAQIAAAETEWEFLLEWMGADWIELEGD